MDSTELHHEFQTHPAYSKMRELVRSLDTRVQADAPDIYEENEEEISSVLHNFSYTDFVFRDSSSTNGRMVYRVKYEQPVLRLELSIHYSDEQFDRVEIEVFIKGDFPRHESEVIDRRTLTYVLHPDGSVTKR